MCVCVCACVYMCVYVFVCVCVCVVYKIGWARFKFVPGIHITYYTNYQSWVAKKHLL